MVPAMLRTIAFLCLVLGTPVLAGTVEGTVAIKSPMRKKASGQKVRVLRYKPEDQKYPGRERGAAAADEVRNVVISLVGVRGKGPSSETPQARIVQKNREFVPFVLPVVTGTKVEFPNLDGIFHGIYSDSPAKRFRLPEYPKGESRTVVFDKPGVVELFCGIHTHMNAYVVVLDNPYFAMPGEDHRFQIPNVPPGRYVLKAWHPRLDPITRMIEVSEARPARVELDL